MATKVKWYGKRFNSMLYKLVDRKIDGAASKVASMAKSLAPVDSGDLQQSIEKVRVSKMHYRVQSDEEYALAIEFGTTKSSPHPYFRPAMNALRGI